MSSEAPLVRSQVAAGVATVTLDSVPNRNALSRRLLTDLRSTLETVSARADVRVIVLTGEGTVFCSGADLKEQREAAGAGSTPPLSALPAILTQLWDAPQPVLCRLNGPARAGGVGLLASCDLVVAPPEVTFSFTEVRLGVVPAVISVPVLRRVSAQAVHRLFLTGEVFDAVRAREIGLVDEVATDGDLDTVVERLVGMLLRGAPEALALTKALTRTVGGLPPQEAFARMAQLSEERFASAEGREGMASFAEKRDASWIPAATPAAGAPG